MWIGARVGLVRSMCSPKQPLGRERRRAAKPSRASGLRALTVASLAVGCTALACSLFRGAINDSPSIRWWLFSNFGANRMCPEMLKRSAPLRLTPDGNVVGRLFPNGCQHRVDEHQRTVSIEFSGTGYAWTPIAGRVGFAAHAAVQYRADFSLQPDAMYVWARTERLLFPPEFRIGGIENRLVNWAHEQGPVPYMTRTFGSQIASSQLLSGFTVVRTEEGDSFSLGILSPPERPREAFASGGEGRVLVASEVVEIRPEQVDFIGPIIVEDSDLAVFFKYGVQGPGAEAHVYNRYEADAFRERLQTGAPIEPPLAGPIVTFPLPSGATGEQRVPLPPGHYMLVVDHSSRIGRVSPPWNLLNTVGANPVVLSYRVEIGEAP